MGKKKELTDEERADNRRAVEEELQRHYGKHAEV
jgi:hypothetical protein